MLTLDSHQHYWQLERFDYGWIAPGNAALHQDRLPDDVRLHMLNASIERAMLVHATSTADEIPWLLSLCNQYSYIAGVVGHLNMASPGSTAAIGGFARDPRFRGVRMNLPYAPRDSALISTSLQALDRYGLSCDLLVGRTPAALIQAASLANMHPGVPFILDHLAGIHLTLGGETDFADLLLPFAALPNIALKISGYLTSSDNIPIAMVAGALQPYLDVALNVLGPARLMFGSDWPVCTQRGSYGDTVGILRNLTSSLSTSEKAAIWGGTAERVYRLQDGYRSPILPADTERH